MLGGDWVKKERLLSILLFLLSLGLVLGPIVAAFSANGWDPKATLLGSSNPLETQFGDLQNLNTENMIGNISLERFDNMTLTDLITQLLSGSITLNDLLTPQNHTLTATVQITSPLGFSIKIKNISGNIKCKEHSVVLGPVQLTSEVEIPAHGSKNLTFVCTLTQDGQTDIGNHLLGGGLPSNIGLENAGIKLDIYGIILEGAIGSI